MHSLIVQKRIALDIHDSFVRMGSPWTILWHAEKILNILICQAMTAESDSGLQIFSCKHFIFFRCWYVPPVNTNVLILQRK